MAPTGVEAYPLSWPAGWKRSRVTEKSKFKTGFGAARKYLFDELHRMGASRVILSTNIPLRNDGMPRANMRADGGDNGVAVYFLRSGKDMVFACDKFNQAADNIYAIGKTIDALRGIERWGASDMMERAFSGFKALAAPSLARDWWDVLDCRSDASAETIQAQYRARIRSAHPDLPGGSHEATQELNVARDQGLAARRGA